MQSIIKLPKSQISGGASLTSVIAQRRSIRDFSEQELTLEEIGQILWAAQGITEPNEGLRTVPSAGAQFPLEIYVTKKDGLFQYDPIEHAIIQKDEKDMRRLLGVAADQMFLEKAPAVFIITCFYERTTRKYGERGIRYVHLDTGHVGQNILLQATALGLGGVPIGAFNDREISKSLNLKEIETPLYMIPVGKLKTSLT